MKKGIGIALVVLCLVTETLLAQQPLTISRVFLYKNGMAYIVRSGQITSPVSLTFHPEDMNDVLKSFTAWNPDNQALYSVGYTTGIPSSRTLARFPFDISAVQTGLGGFLIQVQGAEIRLDHNGKDLQGKLVATHAVDRPTAPQTMTKDHRVTLLLKDGALQTLWLSDVRSLEFVDTQLREQLRSYLDVLAAGRQDVTREVSVYPVPGTGPIRVGYLQQFPLWKTSYRIDLGRESRIQGWAQIDNSTGESWDNVRLSLLSGAPVSFEMNLYDPLYTQRSKLPVPGGIVAAPRKYESAVEVGGLLTTQVTDSELGRGNGQIQITTRSGTMGEIIDPDLAGESRLVFNHPAGTKVGDFFEYEFPFPVQLASRQSALLPFVQKVMDVERLSIFNGQSDTGNARIGARLHNNTDVPLEAGPVTFFEEGRYAGEGVMDYVPRGDRRLVSYGVDYDLQVGRKQQSQPETTTRLSVSRGVAVATIETAVTTTYEIRNRGANPKSLIIEHPRHSNHTLDEIKPYETTEMFHRFRVDLAAGQMTQFTIPEIVSRRTAVQLEDMDRNDLKVLSTKETPAQLRARLGEIVDIQEQVERRREEVKATQQTIDTLVKDQDRLRENLKALRDTSEDQQLRLRYLDQLRRQEDRIDASRAQIESTEKTMATDEQRLSELIANLTFSN